jgi:lipopolysaccharide biosynthesis protein
MTKVIAFYLPQFHPIPENDLWWGQGFTEWTNVAKSKPRFRGHYQPHIPSDLGFYDLRLHETRVAQAELASLYGIGGFCYYHYWFNEKMLLEKPFNEVRKSEDITLPFCLCWANENWTRRWDGLDRKILIAQEYESYDPYAHIKWLEQAFSDDRYIKIEGKPLMLIYRSEAIPNIKSVIETWRDYIVNSGYPGIYLCAVNGAGCKLSLEELICNGFDAIVDFQPNLEFMKNTRWTRFLKSPKRMLSKITDIISSKLNLHEFFPDLKTYGIIDYKYFVKKSIERAESNHKLFPCIFPSWDNSSRRTVGATIIQNDDTEIYGEWLEDSIKRVKNYPTDEKFVFVNAWNEWAEGCHLEPDLRNGHKFLEKTKATLEKLTP